jgi:hypothetical protein
MYILSPPFYLSTVFFVCLALIHFQITAFYFDPSSKSFYTEAYITNIEVDEPNGQIYVTDSNALYEIDTDSFQQNAFHNTSGMLHSINNNKDVVIYTSI